jgi:hypothetical protein
MRIVFKRIVKKYLKNNLKMIEENIENVNKEFVENVLFFEL